MAEMFDASGKPLGDPNAPETIVGRSDSDRAAEIETERPPGDGTASDPATRGAMGGQSGGANYEHPAMGRPDGDLVGGQSNPGYSGTGRLAGKKVGEGADDNAVTHGAHDRKAP